MLTITLNPHHIGTSYVQQTNKTDNNVNENVYVNISAKVISIPQADPGDQS